MTTKEYLNQVDRLNRMIDNKLAEIYQLKTLVCSISVATDSEKVKSSGSQDKMGDTIAKIVDMEKETDEIIDKMLDVKQKIVKQIESIENTNYYDVLCCRYIGRMTFEKIAEKLHYSKMQVIRIHEKALQEFEKKFGKDICKDVTKCY